MDGWSWGLRGRMYTHACTHTHAHAHPRWKSGWPRAARGVCLEEVRLEPSQGRGTEFGEGKGIRLFAGLLWEESVYALRLEFSSFFLLFSFFF